MTVGHGTPPAPQGDVVRIVTGVALTSLSGASVEGAVEIPRAQWDGLSLQQRDELLTSIADTAVENEVNSWAYPEGES